MPNDSAPQRTLARVRQIETKKLFGMYDHVVPLSLDDRVTIVHGANGVGKTVLLRLLHALFSQDYLTLMSVPYDELIVSLVGGTELRVKPTRIRSTTSGKDEDGQMVPGVQIEIVDERDHTIAEFSVRKDQFAFQQWAQRFAQRSPYVSPMGPDRYYDPRTEVTFSASELWRAYGSDVEPVPLSVSPSPEFQKQITSVKTYLVEAQRLMRVSPQKSKRYERAEVPVSFSPAVTLDAQEIASQLRDAFTQYGRISQKLDQTFPQRLFEWRQALSVDEIRKILESIENEQARLAKLGVLEVQPTFQLPLARLASSESAKLDAMELFVTDGKEKLQPLLDFASRVEPLLSNINAKFKNKAIRLDRERGLVAKASDGAEINPDQLSSGEQHELVMLFHLLFRISQNTLVLIDEPELSLHIDWQRRFLPELLAIVGRTQIDALVATHSPNIVGERADLMIDLESTERATN